MYWYCVNLVYNGVSVACSLMFPGRMLRPRLNVALSRTEVESRRQNPWINLETKGFGFITVRTVTTGNTAVVPNTNTQNQRVCGFTL